MKLAIVRSATRPRGEIRQVTQWSLNRRAIGAHPVTGSVLLMPVHSLRTFSAEPTAR
jgi:hypothetical protein